MIHTRRDGSLGCESALPGRPAQSLSGPAWIPSLALRIVRTPGAGNRSIFFRIFFALRVNGKGLDPDEVTPDSAKQRLYLS